MSGQSGGHRLRLSMLNDQLTCKLCGGYFIDATTIIECLHSFCRSCIVKYLANNKYCPICEVQVHKSKPLLNIRPDHTLQDIVYKLVPACYQNEMRCRREFYAKNPEALRSTTSPEARGEPVESHIYSPDESLSLSLEYYNPADQPILVEPGMDDAKETGGAKKQHEQKDQQQQLQLQQQRLQQKPLPKRYLRCPAAVTVFHLQKLIRAKYGLSEAHRVDVMYKEETLCDSYTLMDVMYIYHWRRKVPLHLSYRIFESSPKRLKLAEDNENFKQSLTSAGIKMPVDPRSEGHGQQQQQQQQQQSGPGGKREWKEVQLKISETGVMSVTDITSPDSKKNAKTDKKAASGGAAGSSAVTTDEQEKRPEESVSTDNVNKSEKTAPEVKRDTKASTMTDYGAKTRDGRITTCAEVSNDEKVQEEASRKTEVAPATPSKTGTSVSPENSSDRDSVATDKATIRETRSRSDLRSAANSHETSQQISFGDKATQRAGTETRRSKVSLMESSGTQAIASSVTVPEKSSVSPPKGGTERVAVAPIEEDKVEIRTQPRALTTNNNLVNTNVTSNASKNVAAPTVAASNEDVSSSIQTSNNKNSKNQGTKNSQQQQQHQQQTSAGSKIDALSAKLQFQPKIGEVNNTYSKKAPKEKRNVLDKVSKKSSTQASSLSSTYPASSSVTCSSSSSSSSSSSASSSYTSSASCLSTASSENPLSVKSLGKNVGDATSLKSRLSSSSLTVTSGGTGKSIRIDSGSSVAITSSTPSQIMNCLGGVTTITSACSTNPSSSVSISVTTLPRTANERNDNTNTGNRRPGQSNEANSEEINAVGGGIICAGTLTDHRQTHHQVSSASGNQNFGKTCYGRRDNQSMPIPSSESLASIGLNVSTSMQTSASTFPYTVQDLVNSGILKNSSGATKVSGLTIQKTSGNFGNSQISSASGSLSSTPLSQVCSSVGASFNLHTPSMSIYSIPTSVSSSSSSPSSLSTATTTTSSSLGLMTMTSISATTTTPIASTAITTTPMTTTAATAMASSVTSSTNATMTTVTSASTTKNNSSGSIIGSSLYSNASTQITNSSNTGNKVTGMTVQPVTGTTAPKSNSLEITSIYSSVPPCPDAIPISLMKPSVRKHEAISKSTNINPISAKIGTTGGSKINDICAKIGENSKEKNKAESAARSRPEIPDLLKIGKKTLQPSSTSSSSTSSSLSLSLSESGTTKHIPNIPNVPIYTPSNTIATADTKISYSSKDSPISKLSSSSASLTSVMQSGSLQVTKASGGGIGKKPSMSMGYKTLRDPPKSWNPTLTKNNYVAMKNQAKDALLSSQQSQQSALMSLQQQQQQQQQQHQDSSGGNGKAISIKPAKRHNRNVPRFLGNPASGVKPLYGVTDGKGTGDGKDHGTIATSGVNTVSSGKNSSLSMTKVDPKTLSPIVSSSNSPIVSPPPYSPGARGTCYQTTPFSREMCVSRGGGGGSPISTRSSPVNILSTNPFIPSPTPNTNPRLIYPHFPSPFPDASRFPNPLIRSPIGIPPPSAFHNSLPPSINKIYQRTSYMSQTTGVYSQQQQQQQQQQISQPPTIQRIPASSGLPSSSPSPKSPKKSNSPGASYSMSKTEVQASTVPGVGAAHGDAKSIMLLGNKATTTESNAFNLSKSAVTSSSQQQLHQHQQHQQAQSQQQQQTHQTTGGPSESTDKSGKTQQSAAPTSSSQAKRDTAVTAKVKEEAEKQRRASGDNERGKFREDSGEERLEACSAKKSDETKASMDSPMTNVCRDSDNVTSRDETKQEIRGVENATKDPDKIGAKVNGDLNTNNEKLLGKSQQESVTRNEQSQDTRPEAGKTQLSHDSKETETKMLQQQQQALISQRQQDNKSPAGEKNEATRECNDAKVEQQEHQQQQQHIGKSGDQIQGKTNKATNPESQRSKAES